MRRDPSACTDRQDRLSKVVFLRPSIARHLQATGEEYDMASMDPTGGASDFGELDETSLQAPYAPHAEQAQIAGEPTTSDAASEADTQVSLVPLPRRPVSGRYRSAAIGFQLELRVDVDRTRPTHHVSGDFFSISGATKSYFGSFIVHAPTITVSA